MHTEPSHSWDHPVPPHEVQRAVRLSYVQAMLSAIYVASTSGMFVTGYALLLGARNIHIGLLSTIPMIGVVSQVASAMLIERGWSRRMMTIVASGLNAGGWVLAILLPYILAGTSSQAKLLGLISIFTLLSLFGQLGTNARASWLGDLIPARRLGSFFGRTIMFGGIIGAILAVIEGYFLDAVKSRGIPGFSSVFLFGMLFGLIHAALFAPQADVPVEKHEHGGMFRMARETFSNRPLMALMAFAALWSMQCIAWPFYPTYLLRDVKISFLGLSLLNTVSTVVMLVSSPFWGRVVGKYGCRPVLIACSAVFVVAPLIWIWATTPKMVYILIAPANIITGFMVGGISVAMNTLVYKLTPSAGRSMQLAVYSVTITALIFPMPIIGARVPDWLSSLGLHTDLRATFWSSMVFPLGALIAATRIRERDSRETGELVANLPRHVRRPRTLKG